MRSCLFTAWRVTYRMIQYVIIKVFDRPQVNDNGLCMIAKCNHRNFIQRANAICTLNYTFCYGEFYFKILHKMSNEELKKQIAENEALHIADVMRSLRNDPNVGDCIKNYDNTEKYLRELIDKDGSLMKGIVYALETYLEK